MERLKSADLEAVLAFVGDVAGLEFEEPYPFEVLARMRDLVRCDCITYQDCDPSAKRLYALVGVGPDDDNGDELYWSVGPCLISDDRTRTPELRAVTQYFRPAGLDHVIDLHLPATPPRHRSFVLFRARGAGDFSPRDRAVLELLRPHLSCLEAHAALRRQLSEALRPREGGAEPNLDAELTPREREIVMLVAEGQTNAQIAAQLWVAPSTVKKHLEHIYTKLGVGRRTAAARLLGSAR